MGKSKFLPNVIWFMIILVAIISFIIGIIYANYICYFVSILLSYFVNVYADYQKLFPKYMRYREKQKRILKCREPK